MKSISTADAQQPGLMQWNGPHSVDGFGVSVILPTSKAADGAKTGYELPLIKAIAEHCSAEAEVGSGGAGTMEHFYQAVEAASILLAASVFHFHLIDIPELKRYLSRKGAECIFV